MLRNLHPLELLAVLGAVVLLRWQTLQPEFLPEADAEWLQLGKRIAAGNAAPYSGTLTHELPLRAWAAGLFYFLFGDAAAWALRLLACLSVATAAILARTFYTERKLGVYGYGAALGVGLALCLPWQIQQLGFLVFSLPLAVAVMALAMRCAGQRRPRWTSLAAFGLALGTAFLWQAALWPLALLALAVFVGKDGFRPPALLRIGAGLAIWGLVLVFYVWATGNWQLMGGLLQLPRLVPTELSIPKPIRATLLQPDVLVFVGLWVGFGLAGWASFRVRLFREAVTARKADGLLAVWMGGALAGLWVSWPLGSWQHLQLVAPVAGLYGCYALEHLPRRHKMGRWVFRAALGLVVLASGLHGFLPFARPIPSTTNSWVGNTPRLPFAPGKNPVFTCHLPARVQWKLRLVPGNPTAVSDSGARYALHALPLTAASSPLAEKQLLQYYTALQASAPHHWLLTPADEDALRQRFPLVLPSANTGQAVWVGAQLYTYYHTPHP